MNQGNCKLRAEEEATMLVGGVCSEVRVFESPNQVAVAGRTAG